MAVIALRLYFRSVKADFDPRAVRFGRRARTGAPLDSRLKPSLVPMSKKIRSYAELQELIRVSLRTQHPEWVEPNGDSPICDCYEARFAELLGLINPRRGEDEGSFL
jgi:hypothetical protein